MKIFIITVCIAILLTLGAFAAGHRYLSGHLSGISDNSVTITGEKLRITGDTVFLREYQDDGSYYREEIRQRKLKAGDKVRIKAMGRDVLEIVEEDY